jgi:hypothetical protein
MIGITIERRLALFGALENLPACKIKLAKISVLLFPQDRQICHYPPLGNDACTLPKFANWATRICTPVFCPFRHLVLKRGPRAVGGL